MKRALCLVMALLSCFLAALAQNIFPEKLSGCSLSPFCLDCGDVKAGYSGDLNMYLAQDLISRNIRAIEGTILVQVLIDTSGNQCVLSMDNKATGRDLKKLDLARTINGMTGWRPAYEHGQPKAVSVVIRLDFKAGRFGANYLRYHPERATNGSSVGDPEILHKTENASSLQNDFRVLTKQNSPLPWDMTRAIEVDSNDVVWVGTDNGIVRIANGDTTVFTPKNSPVEATSAGQATIMYACVDTHNNKWFASGGRVYRYDDKNWTVFGPWNSPVEYPFGIYADKAGNVWFPGSEGLAKYDGKSWSVMDTSNSKLPSNRIWGVFVDSRHRLWIGTDSGTVRVDATATKGMDGAGVGGRMENLGKSADNPLNGRPIVKGFEDREGNIWLSLYEKFPAKTGLVRYARDGSWSVVNTENSGMPRNDILDFVIDEKTHTTWISVNRVGLAENRGKEWAAFTPANSAVPSTYIQHLAIDREGRIWAATFAGVLRIDPK